MTRIDVAVVGGGVVGLATALALATRRRSVCVLERHPRLGQEGSTHNSGVIHAGLYYPPGSLKARLCVEGRERLYRFCAEHAVPHRRCGKLVVASSGAEVPRLEALAERGRANGVDDLEVVGAREVGRLEPQVRATAAIWSPSTGIIEAEAFVRALARLATRADVVVLPGTEVVDGRPHADGLELETGRETIRAAAVVNAAGLHADELSARLGGETFTIYPVRGEYAELSPAVRNLVTRPIYPLPEPSGHGLGVHVTPTTWGSVMLGPTARYQTDKSDYEGTRLPLEAFFESARRLLPALQPDHLQPGGTGIRARPAPADQAFSDFILRPDAQVPTLIHAAGIDSPGLTASLAIGEHVADLVDGIR